GGDPAADHRVDLYAVGLLAYELLTGVAPFTGASPQAVMAAQLTKRPEAIDRHRPDVPAPLASLVMHCLAKAPEARPQSAAELAAALDEMSMSSGDDPPQRPRRRAARAAAVVVLIGAAVVFSRRGNPPAPPAPAAAGSAKVSPLAPSPRTGRALLTREESLAIAAAVQKRLAPTQAASTPSAASTAEMARLIDSLVKESERRLIDSLARNARQDTGSDPMRSIRGALIPMDSMRLYTQRNFVDARGPDSLRRPRGGRDGRFPFPGGFERRRVIVTELPSRDSTASPGSLHLVADSLTHLLSRIRAFTVVPADSVRAELAKSRVAQDVGAALHAQLFASVGMRRVGQDSVSFVVILRDLGAATETRRAVTMPAVSIAQPLTGIERLLAPAVGDLLSLSRSPRADSTHTGAAAAPPPPDGTAPPALPTPPARKP
ncbi:MAG: hypothetical protein HYR75_07340, partial [Gemmatimonadetes bacterium]|nr:hypothetical protein [Gemmatimonadota bacterium]